uniref:Uncharacterized protein n=1 Tax=Arundo donax TaxID=35708 RepID=A0A0A9FNA1_ARUDO
MLGPERHLTQHAG